MWLKKKSPIAINMRWTHGRLSEDTPKTAEQHVYVPIDDDRDMKPDDLGSTLDFKPSMNPPLSKTAPSAPDLYTLLQHESQLESQTQTEQVQPRCSDGKCTRGDPLHGCCFYDSIVDMREPQKSADIAKTQKAIMNLNIYKIVAILAFVVVMVIVLLLFVIPP